MCAAYRTIVLLSIDSQEKRANRAELRSPKAFKDRQMMLNCILYALVGVYRLPGHANCGKILLISYHTLHSGGQHAKNVQYHRTSNPASISTLFVGVRKRLRTGNRACRHPHPRPG
jgi:D-Tyr-tRNAtyr deacylase